MTKPTYVKPAFRRALSLATATAVTESKILSFTLPR